MTEQPEDFVPESLRARTPAEQAALREFYRRHKAGGADSTAGAGRFVTLFLGALALLVIGAFVLDLGGPVLLAWWLGCLLAGRVILAVKSQALGHLFWPALLGPLGLVILLVLPNTAGEALRQEELRVQKAILQELQVANAKKGHQ